MKMERCKNGHLFNLKKYNICPYCDEEILEEDKSSPNQNKPEAGAANSQRGSKTVAYWNEEEGINPVVGWLVCIAGVERGKDYKIRSEKNFIGRAEEMHIHINGDNAISRRNHAIISYNPKQRNFMIIPGAETTGIIYVNEEAIYAPTEITAYDVIEMGSSKFIFISLCGKHFEWDNDL